MDLVMSTEYWLKGIVLALLATSGAATAQAEAREEEKYTGIRFQIDNDLFAGRELDRDYTGGLAVTISGTAARDGALSLDPLLARVDDRLIGAQDEVHHARQFGFMAFTPQDIVTREPQPNDRPYASLIFTSNGRVAVASDQRTAWSSSLTVGVLGASVAEKVHSFVHDAVGSERPRGYEHQISAGGEPTARYTLARHSLLVANPGGTVDVKTTVQGSVGFLTEASAAVSMRVGRFNSPWWSFTPELTDYMAAATPAVAASGAGEMFFFVGARVKARGYNAFLQGQFRDSAVTYSAAELEPVLAEAWAGFVMPLFGQTQLAYSLNYQTSEVREGPADRDSLWGAVQVTHVF
jgi:hypothetical protein